MIELFFDVLVWIAGTVVWLVFMIFGIGTMLNGYNGWYQLVGLAITVIALAVGVTTIGWNIK